MPTLEANGSAHTIHSNDGAVSIRSLHRPDYIHEVVVEVVSPPELAEPSDIIDLITQEAVEGKRSQIPRELTDWLYLVGPYNAAETMLEGNQLLGETLKALGFSAVNSSMNEGEKLRSDKKVGFPSVAKANRFMRSVFGQSDWVFAEFDGSDYPAETFVENFIRRRILMANKLPHSVHDMSDHLIGWMGLGEDFLEIVRDRIEEYSVRSDAEERLPKVAATAENETGADKDKTELFFNPSRLVLTEAVRKLDVLTGRVGLDAIGEISKNSRGPEDIVHAIGEFFSFYGNFQTEGYIPNHAFGLLPLSHFDAFAQQAIQRYAQMEEAAADLKVS